MLREYLFTSESVSGGHPDKLADMISDTILNGFLASDTEVMVPCVMFVSDALVSVRNLDKQPIAIETVGVGLIPAATDNSDWCCCACSSTEGGYL